MLGFPGDSMVKDSPDNAGASGDTGSIPRSGRSPGGGNGNTLQYSCQDNPMDRGAWQAIVLGSQSIWQLSNWAHKDDICIWNVYIYVRIYIYMVCVYIPVQFSRLAMSNSLWPHESQHARPPCPSPTPGVYSNTCPLSWWCHPAISSSVIPFSSCPQSLPASGSFPMSQLFAWGGQSIGVSASTSVLPITPRIDLL